jgi:HAD superfamily hydrolase (TIGR01549 family)
MTSASTHPQTTPTPSSRAMTDYRAWLVDLDGTLYRPRGVKLAMAAELAVLGWRDIRVVQAFRHEHERMRDAVANGSSQDTSANAVLRSAFEQQIQRTALGLSMPEADVELVINRWMIERPGKWLKLFRRRGLLEKIADFRQNGGRTALVSDYPASRKLAAIGVANLFEVVISNGEHGTTFALKPNPAAFLAAAERLRVAPEHCLVIGDRDDADGQAASAAGMDFYHVDKMKIQQPG